MTHVNPGPKSFANPPLHLHVAQTEDFIVTSGSGIWHMPYHTDPSLRRFKLSAEEGMDTARVPIGEPHRFENLSEEEPLVLRIRLDERDYPVEERFFRNFFGYIDDCTTAKMAPSVFQLFLFLYGIGTALVIPVPGPRWLRNCISRLVNVLLGVVVGSWMLGYRMSYPEYYDVKAENFVAY